MSGVAVIRELLLASAEYLAMVSAENTRAGVLPIKTPVPAVGVMSISIVPLNFLAPGSRRRFTERVQVTALADDYVQKEEILALARRICADRLGEFADVTEVSVLLDSAGPDFTSDDGSIVMQSQDFSVGYNVAT